MESLGWVLRGGVTGVFLAIVLARQAEHLRFRRATEVWLAIAVGVGVAQMIDVVSGYLIVACALAVQINGQMS